MIFLMILERVLLPEPFVPLILTDGKVMSGLKQVTR